MHTSFLLKFIAADAAIKVYKKVIFRLGLGGWPSLRAAVALNVRGGGLNWGLLNRYKRPM